MNPFVAELTRAELRGRLRDNGYGFFSSLYKINAFNAPAWKLDDLLVKASREAGATLPMMPYEALGDGELLKQFLAAMREFFASPLGQAVQQILIRLLLSLVVI